MVDSELEREIMMYLPTVVGWIEKGQDITEADVNNLKHLVPDHFEFGVSTPFEEIVKMDENYLNHPKWGPYMKVLLSDPGKAWLNRNLILLRKYSEDK
jgi:hypothetical protein